MSRPSQQTDLQLIASAMALLPETGTAGLSVRQVCEHAGVNLGMFHYHFKNKDNFIRTVLQRMYEDLFSALQLGIVQEHGALDNLRAALTVLGTFAGRHRRLLAMLVAETMRGEPLPATFLRENLPRHIAVLAKLIQQGQADGSIVPMPLPMLLPFLFGSVAAPLLIGATVERLAGGDAALLQLADMAVLSPAALECRITFALRGIAAPLGTTS